MKFADSISNLPNAFKPSPLIGDELNQFYFDGTMYVRTGDRYASPIEDIYEACKEPSDHNAFLLLGHKGCGKSTELNHMSARLTQDGYQVVTVQCGMDLDLNNPLYADLLMLMGEALLKIAEDADCEPDPSVVQTVSQFWAREGEEAHTVSGGFDASAEAGATLKAPRPVRALLDMFASVKSDLKYSEENRKSYRERITKRSSEWIAALTQIADQITWKLDGKQPIIIFEDLDKLNPDDAWKVFYQHAVTLTGVPVPTIYTFPIALSYDPQFSALEGYFTVKTLPMIKLENINGSPCRGGYDTIMEIIDKRTRRELFDEEALDYLIRKTGGSLRDLFFAINSCAQRATRRKSPTIQLDDASSALVQLKSSLTRRIENRHYAFLADICRGNRQRIEDREMLLEMLLANTVLEYNGQRWHNVHPLVADFLQEQGII